MKRLLLIAAPTIVLFGCALESSNVPKPEPQQPTAQSEMPVKMPSKLETEGGETKCPPKTPTSEDPSEGDDSTEGPTCAPFDATCSDTIPCCPGALCYKLLGADTGVCATTT
ncbi:MAG: hypothetical protein ACXVEF_40460 [Polyangiales bacterium]